MGQKCTEVKMPFGNIRGLPFPQKCSNSIIYDLKYLIHRGVKPKNLLWCLEVLTNCAILPLRTIQRS